MLLFIRPIEILDVFYLSILLITGIYKWIYIKNLSALVDVQKKQSPIGFKCVHPRLLFIPLISYFYEYYLIFRFSKKSESQRVVRFFFGFKIVELISVVLLFQTFWPYPMNFIAFWLYHTVLIGKMFCRYKLTKTDRIDYIGLTNPYNSKTVK